MTRLLVASAVALWAGTTLLLSTTRWCTRRPLAVRVRPYLPGGQGALAAGTASHARLRDVVAPLSRAVGDRLARLCGVGEDLAVRLARVHSPLDVTGFRVRQLGWAVAGFAGGGLLTSLVRPSPAVGLLVTLGAPLLAFLVVEQRLATASQRWQRRVFLELPVVGEQIGLLLSAGYSLSGALTRVARRGDGACARDLARVTSRVRQGLDTAEALREWAALAQVDAVDRLVHVLALDRETGDLGRLIAEEARAVRRDVHREQVARIQRRAQEVWIPVTVAALLPGVVFLAVPFAQALSLFSAS